MNKIKIICLRYLHC